MSFFSEVVLNGKHWVVNKKTCAVVVGETPDGRQEVLFRGEKGQAINYSFFLQRCHAWIMDGADGDMPCFYRPDTGSSGCPDSFEARVQFAAAGIREGRIGYRDVDACFEQFDGQKVVMGLMNIARNDPFLRAGLRKLGKDVIEVWRETQRSGGGLPLLASNF